MKEQFLNRMKDYLGDEYEAYMNSLEEPLYRGVRINTCKASIEEVVSWNICTLTPSSICKESFYIEEDIKGLGNHPAHVCGSFYMQEPSASSAVEVLDVQKGDWVLDVCAAPGGKSTQIATKLAHTGFLVSNEIEHKRAQILLSNMERLGFSECMITNAHPDVLCKAMAGCFDRVLVDAPCSGEGMFKKHSKAMEDWSMEHVQACAKRQLHILESAYDALKEGGILVYSTCTYSMEENEGVVDAFLKLHDDIELLPCDASFGRCGLPYKDVDETKVVRIFPMDKGEGHFVAKMKKHGVSKATKLKEYPKSTLPVCVDTFLHDQLDVNIPYVIQVQDKIYGKQTPFIKLKDIKVLRQGIMIGDVVKQRLEPHLHFYTASVLQPYYKQRYDMTQEECLSFLKGNVLPIKGIKGHCVMTWNQHPIAFSKGDGMSLKNKYPKGLRLK